MKCISAAAKQGNNAEGNEWKITPRTLLTAIHVHVIIKKSSPVKSKLVYVIFQRKGTLVRSDANLSL